MAGRWEKTGRAVLAALAVLLLALSLPGAGTMETAQLLPDGIWPLPDGVWPLPFPIGQLLRLALAALTAV